MTGDDLEAPPEPSILTELRRMLQEVRDSKPTVLVHPDDYERIKDAAADLWCVVEASRFVEAGEMLYLAPMAEMMKGLVEK